MWTRIAEVILAGWVAQLALAVPAACTFASPPAPASFVALTAEGKELAGELVELDDDWQLTLQLDDGSRHRLAGAELIRLGRPGNLPDVPVGPQVVLATGERLRGVVVTMDEEALRLRSESVGMIRVPLECVYGVILAVESDPTVCNRLVSAIRSHQPDADELWLANDDRLRGTILSVASDKITLDQDGTELTVPRNQVKVIVLNRQLIACEPPEGLHAVAVLDDGSELRLTRAQLRGSRLHGLTGYGSAEVTIPLERLRLLEFYGGRVVYLSDLEPARYRYVPYLGRLRYGWQRDQAIGGTPLRLRGRRYRKGIGVHSRSELTYTLNGEYRLFRAVVGVDDNTGGGGSVVFRVLVDGQEKFRSEPLTGNSAPATIQIPLDGAKELTLITDFGAFGDVLDHADWADALLIRR